MAPMISATEIRDKAGYLKMLLSHPCPWGHPRIGCALKPYLRAHPDLLGEEIVKSILDKHFNCERGPGAKDTEG